MQYSAKFPPNYIDKINSLLGDEAPDFFSSLAKPPVVSVRINPFKPTAQFDDCEKVAWCTHGKYLQKRPSFTYDAFFHAGAYYVQEASSMFLSEIINQVIDKTQPLKILDLCASPGGKSASLLSEISNESLLISNETIQSRVAPLQENLMKWGVPNVFISNNAPEDFSGIKNYFDVIVIDAPCSGDGLFRKDENAIPEWSEKVVRFCAARQKKIISDILPALKQNGILIYSTCTFSTEENEENVKFIADKGNFETVKIALQPNWNVVESPVTTEKGNFFGYRFYPHKVKGEGFFIACLRKIKSEEEMDVKPQKRIPKHQKYAILKLNKKEIETVSPWLKTSDVFEFIHSKNMIYAILKSQCDDYIFLSQTLNLRSSGIFVGKILSSNIPGRQTELIPSHDLALSTIISEKIQSVALDYTQAIQYLKKEKMCVENLQKGWVLAKYCGFNIGWMKVLKERINNYFPGNLRIKFAQMN